MQWESNLIGYDAMSSYGSPSYYAQAMFGEYLGTEVPTSSLVGAGDRFFYSVTRDPAKGEVYLKLVNASSASLPVQIDLTGASNVATTGMLVSLTGTNDAETNTITTPKRIVPVKSTIESVAAKFTHTVPPYSVQVIELKAK
jgi:alpha-N-arabinofuranosidase